jgi:hypothetical protein
MLWFCMCLSSWSVRLMIFLRKLRKLLQVPPNMLFDRRQNWVWELCIMNLYQYINIRHSIMIYDFASWTHICISWLTVAHMHTHSVSTYLRHNCSRFPTVLGCHAHALRSYASCFVCYFRQTSSCSTGTLFHSDTAISEISQRLSNKESPKQRSVRIFYAMPMSRQTFKSEELYIEYFTATKWLIVKTRRSEQWARQ